MFHGLTGSPFEMVYYGKMLFKSGYDIYCPILPGHCKGPSEIKKVCWKDWLSFGLDKFDCLKSQYDEVFISGVCLGAVIALAVANEKKDVKAVSALATTLFLDGWGIPWYRFLIPFGANTIYKFFYVFPEADPYGLKNEETRNKVKEMMSTNNDSTLDCFPLVAVSELLKLSNYVRKNIRKIQTPIITIHSAYDDLTSLKSAEFVYKKVTSSINEFVKLENSYHLIVLDNEKDIVTEKTLNFFNKVSSRERIPP